MVELCEVGADDWQRWRAVRLAALADAPEAFGSTLAEWSGEGDSEARWRRRLEDVALNVVGLDDGDPVGQVSGDLAPSGRVHVISMWVAPKARGTGTGEALLGAVQAWAASLGVSELALSVKRSNGPAARLYHRFGFCRSTEVHEDPTEFVMTKPLGEARAAESPAPQVVDGNVRRELLRMLECDQLAARESYEASQLVDDHRGRFLFDVPTDEWLPEYWAAKSTIEIHVDRLRPMVEAGEWPGRARVGDDGARAAWFLAQHAGEADPRFQQSLVPLLAQAVSIGDADAEHLAALRDRVELEAGRLQIFGTHLEPDGDSWRPLRGVANPQDLDARRRDLGLRPWAEYLDDCLNGRFRP